jgi:putative Holliday junction resolvase
VARVLAIDYGTKRCGMAVSDPLGMIANGLPTVDTASLMAQLQALSQSHPFDTVVVGLPVRASGELSDVEAHILQAIAAMRQWKPDLRIERMDERFTSKIAMQSMIAAGATKKQRREKGNIDKVSATLILQEYLNSKA